MKSSLTAFSTSYITDADVVVFDFVTVSSLSSCNNLTFGKGLPDAVHLIGNDKPTADLSLLVVSSSILGGAKSY